MLDTSLGMWYELEAVAFLMYICMNFMMGVIIASRMESNTPDCSWYLSSYIEFSLTNSAYNDDDSVLDLLHISLLLDFACSLFTNNFLLE